MMLTHFVPRTLLNAKMGASKGSTELIKIPFASDFAASGKCSCNQLCKVAQQFRLRSTKVDLFHDSYVACPNKHTSINTKQEQSHWPEGLSPLMFKKKRTNWQQALDKWKSEQTDEVAFVKYLQSIKKILFVHWLNATVHVTKMQVNLIPKLVPDPHKKCHRWKSLFPNLKFTYPLTN